MKAAQDLPANVKNVSERVVFVRSSSTMARRH